MNNKQVENKEVLVPFNQLRLLVLAMEAVKTNDRKKIEQVQEEAATLGIQMSQAEKQRKDTLHNILEGPLLSKKEKGFTFPDIYVW